MKMYLACIDGYSEVYRSSGCKICKRDYWEWLIPVFFLAMVMVFIIILVDRPAKVKRNDRTSMEFEYSKMLIKDDFQAVQLMFLRPFTYFFQGSYCISHSFFFHA